MGPSYLAAERIEHSSSLLMHVKHKGWDSIGEEFLPGVLSGLYVWVGNCLVGDHRI